MRRGWGVADRLEALEAVRDLRKVGIDGGAVHLTTRNLSSGWGRAGLGVAVCEFEFAPYTSTLFQICEICHDDWVNGRVWWW